MEELHSRRFLVVYGLTKALAILVGAALTTLTLMSVVGVVTSILWVHLGVAILVLLGVPLLLANRLLPEDQEAAKGVVTDVLAVVWSLGALAGVAFAPVLIVREANRLAEAGFGAAGVVARIVVGIG
jgi:serine protease Do